MHPSPVSQLPVSRHTHSFEEKKPEFVTGCRCFFGAVDHQDQAASTHRTMHGSRRRTHACSHWTTWPPACGTPTRCHRVCRPRPRAYDPKHVHCQTPSMCAGPRIDPNCSSSLLAPGPGFRGQGLLIGIQMAQDSTLPGGTLWGVRRWRRLTAQRRRRRHGCRPRFPGSASLVYVGGAVVVWLATMS